MPWRDLLSPAQRFRSALPASLREYEGFYTLTPADLTSLPRTGLIRTGWQAVHNTASAAAVSQDEIPFVAPADHSLRPELVRCYSE